jgi:hypothetical protein
VNARGGSRAGAGRPLRFSHEEIQIIRAERQANISLKEICRRHHCSPHLASQITTGRAYLSSGGAITPPRAGKKLSRKSQRAILSAAVTSLRFYGEKPFIKEAGAAEAAVSGWSPQAQKRRAVRIRLALDASVRMLDRMWSRITKTSATGCWLWAEDAYMRPRRYQSRKTGEITTRYSPGIISPDGHQVLSVRALVSRASGVDLGSCRNIQSRCGNQRCVQPLAHTKAVA